MASVQVSDTSRISGMLGLDELEGLVRRDQVRTVIVAFTDHCGRLIGKRFDAEVFVESVSEHGTHVCDYLLANDMEMAPVSGYRFTSWQSGYGDLVLSPDMNTLRLTSWLEKTALALCDARSAKTGQPIAIAPRSILQRQLERAQELSLSSVLASELEYYLFLDSYRDAALKGYAGLQEAGWYSEDYHIFQGTRNENFTASVGHLLKLSGVAVESS